MNTINRRTVLKTASGSAALALLPVAWVALVVGRRAVMEPAAMMWFSFSSTMS